MKTLCFSAAIGFAIAASAAHAAPVPDKSFIQLNYIEEGVPYDGYLSETLLDTSHIAQTLPSAAGQTLQLRGDAASAEVGTRVRSTSETSSAQAIVSIFDTLTFSAAVNVEFSIRLDGSFTMNGGAFAQAYSQYSVLVYDITGRDTWASSFEVFPGLTLVNPDAGLTQVASVSIFEDQGQSSPAGNFAVDVTRTGSFLADPSKTYGILLIGNSYADHGSTADFLNTGAFAFTNLHGATFTSDSGAFLTPTAVPEPGSAWLLVLGLASVPLARKLRRA